MNVFLVGLLFFFVKSPAKYIQCGGHIMVDAGDLQTVRKGMDAFGKQGGYNCK